MTVLVGRDAPLARIAEAQEQAAAGHGGLVLVSGEAGIGKSRVMEAAARRAQTAGITVSRGAGVDDPGCPPLWPWLRLARPWPTLHQLLSRQTDARLQTAPAERFELFVAVADSLVELAEPLVGADRARSVADRTVLVYTGVLGMILRGTDAETAVAEGRAIAALTLSALLRPGRD